MNKFNICTSVYVGLEEYPLNENINYLHFLYENGINRIFISGHMPEVHDNFLNELRAVIEEAKKLQMDIILDVSKPALPRLGEIKDIFALRLDWGFNIDDIVELTKEDYFIELNASVINEKTLLALKSKNVDFSKLRVSHNFYPKPYTGLSQDNVLAKNNLFHQYGMTVMIYIPSSNGKRPPLKEGLPTIEEHRYLDIEAILSELTLLDVDEVCFGDAYCSKEEINAAIQFDNEILQIPIIIYDGISKTEEEILNKIHTNRADQSIYFIRSSCRVKESIPHFNNIERSKFSITIDNKDFLRYQGEVGIMRLNLEKDLRVNVVGKALITDYLLQNFKPSQKFKFVIKGKE